MKERLEEEVQRTGAAMLEIAQLNQALADNDAVRQLERSVDELKEQLRRKAEALDEAEKRERERERQARERERSADQEASAMREELRVARSKEEELNARLEEVLKAPPKVEERARTMSCKQVQMLSSMASVENLQKDRDAVIAAQRQHALEQAQLRVAAAAMSRAGGGSTTGLLNDSFAYKLRAKALTKKPRAGSAGKRRKSLPQMAMPFKLPTPPPARRANTMPVPPPVAPPPVAPPPMAPPPMAPPLQSTPRTRSLRSRRRRPQRVGHRGPEGAPRCTAAA